MAYDVIGKSILRVDGLAKVTGKAVYPQDIYMEDMVYGKTFRSTKAHANIKVDISKAEKLDGVLKVFTAKDVKGENHHGVLFKDHQVFCAKKVRRIGDPIAFVVAESEKRAQDALDLIQVQYEELEAVFDPEEAMKEDSPKIHDNESNIIYHYKIRKGKDIDEAFKECDVVVENTYKTSMTDHAFIQPEAGVSYVDEGGTVVVCVATQYPHFDQIEVAEALGVDKEKVRIINPAVGGAFGGREDITLQIHIAIAASYLKKPIKTIYSREESFIAHSKRHPVTMHVKTGAKKDGTLHAMEARIIGDSGAYASWAINVLRKTGVHISGPYVIKNVKVDSIAVYTNNPFTGAMRGFGAAQAPIAYESQMDSLAEKLNMSPLEIRLKNAFRHGCETATGQILTESIPIVKCLEAVSKAMNLKEDGDR
ncbi:molybdopterin cofactor-binding domain-containing protein [Clostridium sp. Marseille-Q2269]|uniref:xanthine dehydrogenase family protein molybdopterin-binding subunit n=1 Tax=Clostridium sp. Marseille-Q2269 TaxID=2942205 RepID=UPI0020731AE6|nr:molybdopterin cofactor-binding domain-containing protein [Clostridium sp. Marseille-Q2269]